MKKIKHFFKLGYILTSLPDLFNQIDSRMARLEKEINVQQIQLSVMESRLEFLQELSASEDDCRRNGQSKKAMKTQYKQKFPNVKPAPIIQLICKG